ncbi:MAG: hypothetical protein D6808_04425 [Candidatus Dadabacteria bacterium]|nr:MAG: hypothetical protein D6808_04425 [Candidatus Dadabacteria bacterium]
MPTIKEEEPTFAYSVRKLPPEPVYNRLRWGNLPSPIYSPQRPDPDAPLILPPVHFSLKRGTLKDAINMLAAITRYSTYCSEAVCNKRISLDAIGTVHELAQMIAKKADIEVAIDHANREISFLPPASEEVKPSFYKGKNAL